MSDPVEYATAPPPRKGDFGTVHIVRDRFQSRTFCGQRIDERWQIGDETISGIAATCKRCRSIFGVQP